MGSGQRPGNFLDIAANSQEELKEWVTKIREVAMTSEAKVCSCFCPLLGYCHFMSSHLLRCSDDLWLMLFFFSWQLEEGKIMERRKRIALELSELVIYCRPVPFDEDSKASFFTPLYPNRANFVFDKDQCYLGDPALTEIHPQDSHSVPDRDRDRTGLLSGHVILPRDQSREIRQQDQGQEVPAVQPTAAVPHLSQGPTPGLLQLRPFTHVAVWQPAGGAELPDCRWADSDKPETPVTLYVGGVWGALYPMMKP